MASNQTTTEEIREEFQQDYPQEFLKFLTACVEFGEFVKSEEFTLEDLLESKRLVNSILFKLDRKRMRL